MTTFLLLRHAAHDWVGRGIAGRLPGVGLNAEGRRQAQALVQRLAPLALDAIASSPQQRTLETAQPLAQARGLQVEVDAAFDEVDFGAWTGFSFDQLRGQGEPWRHWCERRGSARAPDGEAFVQVPQRAMAGLERLRARFPEGQVAVFSHGDVLKAMVATCLGMSLDDLERFEIAPASVSIVALGEHWQQVKLVNGQGPLSC